jgi:lipopolysaccharide transport system permease protein
MSSHVLAGAGEGTSSQDVLQLPLAVYSSEPILQTPTGLLALMYRDLLNSRELGWRLFVRDLSAQYRQSLLGVTWALLPPILIGLVFIVLHSKNVIQLAPTAIPYPVFALVGTLYWQIFVDALNAPLQSVSGAKSILTRVQFPREALILSALYTVLFAAFLKGLVLLGVLFFFGIPLQYGLLLAPLAIGALIVLGLGIGLALTPLGLLYTDVSSALVVVVQIWFFATPVVYLAPESWPLSLVSTLNPVSPLLTAARDLTTLGSVSNPLSLILASGLACAGLLGAWILYRVALPITIERLSA